VTRKAKFSSLPTQRTLAKAFGVDVRTIRNWKARADKGERHFPFDKEWYWPFAPYNPKLWLITARLKKLHEQFIETRLWDQAHASEALHGICPGHITDPEKRHLFYNVNVGEFIHPAAEEAIKPENALNLAAAKLRLAGKDVTRQALAKALGISLRTLYRQDGAKVRELCPISRRRKPKIDSDSHLYDLAA
jgi:hypothetical protein